METESLELEDGEIFDDDPTDTFGTYNVLQRPHTLANPKKIVEPNYSDDTEETSDSGSDSDPQSKQQNQKRLKLKTRERRKPPETTNKPDKYKIWCTQVQEDALTADLGSCGVTNKFQGRNVENYDLPTHFQVNGFDCPNNSSDDEREAASKTSNKRTYAQRRNVKLRLSKRQNSMEVDSQKGSVRFLDVLSITPDSTDLEVANEIAEKLIEKKDSLIQRIVEIVGKEKAIEFYEETKKTEEKGGLLIMNGSRRRTPGGVYLYLVKNDEFLPQETKREIFAVDKKDMEQRKKLEAAKARQKAKKILKNRNKDSEDLPALLTRAELSTQQLADEARLRRGEGMDRIPIDSERTVSNPPPSPATDDPDHSEHVTGPRQEINEDFLDIGVDIDSMEMF